LFFNCCIPESLARAGLRLGGAHDRALFGCSSDMHTIRDGFVSILVVRQTCVYMYIYKHISCMYVYVYEYLHIASMYVYNKLLGRIRSRVYMYINMDTTIQKD